MVPALFSYRLHFQDRKVKFSRQIATSQNYSETIVFSRIFSPISQMAQKHQYKLYDDRKNKKMGGNCGFEPSLSLGHSLWSHKPAD